MNEHLHTLPDAPQAGGPPMRTSGAADAAPLRAEVFGAAQMVLHGRALAASHTLAHEDGGGRLLARLADNDTVLTTCRAHLVRAAHAGNLPAAAEALLGHDALIDEQIRAARGALPPQAERALPRLAAPLEAAGNPRIHQLALEAVTHGDGRLEHETLARFLAAYQESVPLTLGELRVFPAMLGLALIENLRRIAVRFERACRQRDLAREWAGRMQATAEARPGDLVLLMADMARAVEPMEAAFVAELARRLEGRDGALDGVLQWLGTRLADAGLTLARQVDAQMCAEAADGVSLANTLDSLERLGTIDWRAFLEAASAVEQALRRDPAGVYGRMHPATRAHYRCIVERLARQSGHSETQVAAETLALAGAGRAPDAGAPDERTRHVGHYLVGAGLPALREKLGQRPGLLMAVRRTARRRPLPSWLGTVGVFTLLFTGALVVHAWRGGAGASLLLALALLAACGASQLALALTNMMVARLVPRRPVPRLDVSGGIPDDCRSMVVVPAVVDSRAGVAALCRRLELHYLANRDPQLRFCLLLDAADAPSETMPSDAALMEEARAAVEALNGRYREVQPFLLLWRRRTWRSSERAWIGRERKRGALADLNVFLRGGARERFALVAGNTDGLAATRYVITLDPDTRLPHDGARQMVAAMAHPLNHPLLAADGRRVAAGHGILQPRVTTSLPLDGSSRYARACSGEPGVDPRPHPAPDTCQDLFGEGAYDGQGIYEVDSWQSMLAALPEQAALSHDLLAGAYLRGGLLGDVQLYQPAPLRYRDDVARRHRRIRGDWQLAGWLRTRIKTADGRREANPLTPLARWKLFDRLRHSLVAPTLVGMLVLSWSLLASPAFWSAAVLSVFFLPAFFGMLVDLVDKPHDSLWRQHLGNWSQGARVALRRAVMETAFLPHEAWTGIDAMARTGWRTLVARRRLLQRKPAARAHAGRDIELEVRSMWFAPALAAVIAVLLSFLHPYALFAAAPLLLLWFLSPVIAWWVSLPGERTAPALPQEQAQFLAKLARRTWSYFETWVGPEDNWLPPDSMQEHPNPVLVHRTSPTDMGMALLANLAALDFGFVPQGEVLARVRAAFDSMALLARHRGHFCQWYDTQTLAPLQPMLVSTVDSGNLAAHLLTLASGLEALADTPVGSRQSLAGMRATLQVVQEHAQEMGEHLPPPVRAALAHCRNVLHAEPGIPADTLPGLADCLQGAAQAATGLVQALPPDAGASLRDWCERFERGCHAARDDLLALTPWMRAVQEYVFEASLTRIPTLRELAGYARQPAAGADAAEQALATMVEQGAALAAQRLDAILELAQRAREFADMDFGLLYRAGTGLLAAGYNVSSDALDAGSCELLASEARLASFIGIARGQLPHEHWFALKRPLGIVDGEQLLLSRSGALSDYLAPLLVMPAYRGTLLEKTCQAVVRAQVRHAERHGLPWGMSESGYNTFDEALHYAYGSFGVPGTGLERFAGNELVVAPYASMLALMVAPQAACANLERMAGLGLTGEHGFYEALDCTAQRLPRGQKQASVRSFMAHHQGMGLIALSQLLHARPMQGRFEADPAIAAALPLLYERVPRSGAFDAGRESPDTPQAAPAQAPGGARCIDRPDPPQPEVQLLSNGRYHVMVTSDGGGYSRWHDLFVTRWRGDPATVDAGFGCYLRDLDSGAVWSAGFQPTLAEPGHYEAVFAEGRAELRRVDEGIELSTEIVVAPDDDVELRRMRIRNASHRARSIELTSHAAIVLDACGDGKGSLQGELLAERDAILCTGQAQAMPWLLHRMAVHGAAGPVSFETDGRRFPGRANTADLPAALPAPGPLGGSGGAMPDPALAIRRVLTLAAGEETTVDLVLGLAPTRAAALQLLDQYGGRGTTDRAFELAWTRAPALLRQLGIAEADAALFARLAGAVLYPQRALRADPALIARNRLGQAGLWSYGISGDLPIVLAQVQDSAGLELARQLVQAHAWWRRKGLAVDLVIWYADALQRQVARLVATDAESLAGEGAGGLFAFAFDGVAEQDRVLMQSAARVVLQGKRGSLQEQVRRAAASRPAAVLPRLNVDSAPPQWDVTVPSLAMPDTGSGAFTADGSEYLVRTAAHEATPASWPNLPGDPGFGALWSASGQGSAWCRHTEDPALASFQTGSGVEAFYLRDDASGVFWSPTPLPAPSGADYLARHGFGYSVVEHSAHGIHSELSRFVALGVPLKFTVLKLRNDSSAPRRLSATGYVEWVPGRQRALLAPNVVTGRDPASGALVARSSWDAAFADRIAFFHVDADNAAFTCDRMEFIGRNGQLARPRALGCAGLSGTAGAALDPCAALQAAFELQPGEERTIVFMLGAAREPDLRRLLERRKDAAGALDEVRGWWKETLGAVRVETPDPALDLLANNWLLHEAMARAMGAGPERGRHGAACWRDALQEAMALVHARPEILRERLLLCAAHQSTGDDAGPSHHAAPTGSAHVHGPAELLWLPLATCRYLGVTGDIGILGQSIGGREERAPEPGAEGGAGPADGVTRRGDLYEHCVRAIRHAMRFGAHGLPLAGSGDAGNAPDDGESESVELSFFMIEVLRSFAEVAERRADYGFATTCRAAALALAAQIEQHAWNGAGYRSGFTGAAADPRAIDPLVQSRAVLCGAADPQRAARALSASEALLAQGAGQSPDTLAWAAMAFAHLGQGERAWQLFESISPLRTGGCKEGDGAQGEPCVQAVQASGGRGGANWYTGSAGLMYRLIVEVLLGVQRVGQQLVLAPQLPRAWPGFRFSYRYRTALYVVEVRAAEAAALLVDGQNMEGNAVQLVDDGASHSVELHVVRRQEPAMLAEREETQSKTHP